MLISIVVSGVVMVGGWLAGKLPCWLAADVAIVESVHKPKAPECPDEAGLRPDPPLQQGDPTKGTPG